MTFEPLVTVYLPTCGRLELLKRAVSSVLTQTYRRIELIVVNDGRDDDVMRYLQQVAQSDARLRFFQNEDKPGACAARNIAIHAAQGEFITGLDDDDYFLPTRIHQFVNLWPNIQAKHSEVISLHSHLITLKKKGHSVQSELKKKAKCVKQNQILLGNYVVNQLFTQTEILQQITFNEDLPVLQDLDCWYRLLALGDSMNVMQANYVVDTAHSFPRISDHSAEAVLAVIRQLSDQYQLSMTERSLFENHKYKYDPNSLHFSSILSQLVRYRNFGSLAYLWKRYQEKWF